MKIDIFPNELSGKIKIKESKSLFIRKVICASLSDEKNEFDLFSLSSDEKTALDCVSKIFCDIEFQKDKIVISPKKNKNENISLLNCGESASVFRFLLPVVCAKGISCEFVLGDTLKARPHEVLIDLLKRNGCGISEYDNIVKCEGKMQGGLLEIDGNVSSQYISGLLMALPLLECDSELIVKNGFSSFPYIEMTLEVLSHFGIKIERLGESFKVKGNQKYNLKNKLPFDGDYSSASNFLVMGAFSKKGITVSGLNPDSVQGDKKIIEILKNVGCNVSFSDSEVSVSKNEFNPFECDVDQCPDLFPLLCILASFCDGNSIIKGVSRLKYKESDRYESSKIILEKIGVIYKEKNDGIEIMGKKELKNGFSLDFNDHRMTMALAVLSCISKDKITTGFAECVKKSYPEFFNDFEKIGGIIKKVD